jgi:hypothetical protein
LNEEIGVIPKEQKKGNYLGQQERKTPCLDGGNIVGWCVDDASPSVENEAEAKGSEKKGA